MCRKSGIGVIGIQAERRDGESLFDWHKRLIYGKLVDKTLADMDYSELAELVYGQPYSSDVARRMLYGSRRTLELLDEERVSEIEDADMAAEIDMKVIELQKERQRFFDQRREYKKLVSHDGRLDNIRDALVSAAEDLNNTVGVIYDDPKFTDRRCGESEAVMVFSDWHYGMVADNIFNTYNTEICRKRVRTTVQRAIDRIILHNCRKLHIVILGDLFHGAIHTSARVASEELVCDQIMQVAEILAQSIQLLATVVGSVDVYMTYGNHGRTVANKKDNIHRDNIERLIPWWLEQRLKDNPDIHVAEDSGTEYIVISAAGHDICATHGDLDSVKSSPRLIPSLFFKQFGRNIEYILLGDKHHVESFGELGVTAMLCGSLCGTDDYANDKRLFSEPSQLLLIVDKENGVDAEYRIKCE